MESLIPIVNKLQDVFGAIGQQAIDLPQITVVGSQSAGKSSVLENIVGRDFLPRGSGIVTRRPLVLQLYCIGGSDPIERAADEATKGDEWGEFLHLPGSPSPHPPSKKLTYDKYLTGWLRICTGQRFYDFNEIREEISRETERISGRNKGISNKSINLKIFSPHVLNLTLVDLPGITKVPTGDQPEDVEEQIRAMCMDFISNPNAIILAVTAANSDLANSDGLKMARTVDPDGERTIGVLTKVDIMDAGTDCTEILANRVVPLRKGYIAVVNRSQKDIQDNVPIRQGLLKEQSFFQTHPKYRTLLSKCGTSNMARSLNQILMMHIRDCLPEIKSKINRMMAEVQMNIDAIGETVEDQGTARLGATLLRILSNFSSNFCGCVEGKGSADKSLDTCELYGGARIAYIFKEVFGRSVKEMDPFDNLDDEDIRTAIANATGPRPSLFVSEFSFDLLIRRQILKLEQPGLQCVDLVFDEMHRMAFQAESAELTRFPELRDSLFDIVSQLLRNCMGPTQKMICNLVQIELAYINTAHPDFVGGKVAAQVSVVRKNHGNSQNGTSSNTTTTGDAGTPTSSSSGSGSGGCSLPTQTAAANVPRPAIVPQVTQEPAPNSNQAGFFNIFRATASNDVAKTAAQKAAAATSVMKLPQVPDKMRNHPASTDKELLETEIIKSLISSYFDIVRKNFMDLVPKTIMHFLVNNFKESLQNELVSQLYKEQIMTDLLRETDDIASKRKTYREMKELLRRAAEIVNEVRDFNTFK